MPAWPRATLVDDNGDGSSYVYINLLIISRFFNISFYSYFKPSMFVSLELVRLLNLGFFDCKPIAFAFPPLFPIFCLFN